MTSNMSRIETIKSLMSLNHTKINELDVELFDNKAILAQIKIDIISCQKELDVLDAQKKKKMIARAIFEKGVNAGHFTRRYCFNGVNCKKEGCGFSHEPKPMVNGAASMADGAAVADGALVTDGASVVVSNRKTKICRYEKNGGCKKGHDLCNFLHDGEDGYAEALRKMSISL